MSCGSSIANACLGAKTDHSFTVLPPEQYQYMCDLKKTLDAGVSYA